MKKLLAVLLCVATLACTFAGCAKISQNAEDKGAEIPVYMSSNIYTLDPAYAYTDEAATQILSLVYEGLFSLDQNGKPVKQLCKSYTSGTDRDGNFYMEFTIANTKWSDGRTISANDFVFAWKRLCEPEFASEAVSLLYDVKNAKECKEGRCSIDDLGVVASETNVLRVTFTHKINEENFLATLTSPSLVPLREDKVSRIRNWASNYATMVTNGPFYVKIFTPGDKYMVLERSMYYYRDMESDTQKLDVYVSPYRLNIYFVDAATALEKYNAGEIVLDANLPVDARNAVSKPTTMDTLSTATYYFNVNNPLFASADVRTALSLALDRTYICEQLLTFAKPATGLIPAGVHDTTAKTDFRKVGGDLIASTADTEQAKSLLSKAGVKGGSFTIKIRGGDEVDLLVAQYAEYVWEELGFDVEIVELGARHYEDLEYDQYQDELNEALYAGDFDVIAVDITSTVSQPFAALACFARGFTGSAVDLSSVSKVETTELPIRGDYPPEALETTAADDETTVAEDETTVETTTKVDTQTLEGGAYTAAHLTGYENKEYNAQIEAAYEITDLTKRAEALHMAESMLIADMPVIPMFVYQHSYVKSGKLSGLKSTYYGTINFTKASLSGYEKYKDVELPK